MAGRREWPVLLFAIAKRGGDEILKVEQINQVLANAETVREPVIYRNLLEWF